MHPFVLAKLHRRLLHSASRLSDEGQRVILPSENVDSIRCPPFCQCTYGPRFSICFCTYKWVNLHSYKKALKCYHIWNCWTQSLWFCLFYFLHKTIRSKICPKPYVMNKNKTGYPVHSYSAGKGWIYCNAKNANRGLEGIRDLLGKHCFLVNKGKLNNIGS